MQTLSELLGINPVQGDWGIEIEAEGQGMNPLGRGVPFWRSEDDPSLRGNFPDERHEFVLKKPILLDEVSVAMDALIKSQEGAKIKFSFRTSVHVHMNVSTFTRAQVCSLVYLYLLFEEPLINFCGTSRKANRFALRLRDAEYMMEVIKLMFKGTHPDWHRMPDDQMRYSSLNLEAMRKYGSVEFRGMRGTIDKETIVTWVKLLNFIKEYASKHSVQQISDAFFKKGPLELAKEVFGELVNTLAYDDMARDMAMSYSIAIDLPHSFQADKEEKPKPNRKVKVEAALNVIEEIVNARDLRRQAVRMADFVPAPVGQQMDWADLNVNDVPLRGIV